MRRVLLVVSLIFLYFGGIHSEQHFSEYDVIIVGAGVSGLAAAQEMMDKRASSSSSLSSKPDNQPLRTLILEGRHRAGGRVYTNTDLFGFPLDFGASWIHDAGRGNPITEIVNQNEIEVVYSNYERLKMYDVEGGDPLSDVVVTKTFSQYRRIKSETIIRGKRLPQDQSVQSVWDKVFREYELGEREGRLVSTVYNTEMDGEFGCDPNLLSVKYFNAGEIEFSGEDYLFPDGYSQIISPLLSGLTVVYNSTVIEINYENQTVLVRTQNGQLFATKKVLVTVPLGVLKKEAIKFVPPLPAPKAEAIKNQGFGALNKIILEFKSAPWPITDFFITVNQQGFEFILNWEKVSRRNVLIVFHGGPIPYDNNQTISIIMQTLRKSFPSISDPIRSYVSRWEEDAFSYGSYSYNAIGLIFDETVARLKENVDGKVFFAGEHTSSSFSSTVHGAHFSGTQAAQEILSLLS